MKDPADPGVEQTISGLLRVGVTASLILLAFGTLLAFVRDPRYGSSAADVQRLIGPAGAYHPVLAAYGTNLVHLQGQAVIVAGLFLLILTPIIRVAFSIVAFAREKNSAYVAITTIVLVLLLVSFALGKAG